MKDLFQDILIGVEIFLLLAEIPADIEILELKRRGRKYQTIDGKYKTVVMEPS
jgi:hypothetical protein